MTATARTPTNAPITVTVATNSGPVLQRKCDCGRAAGNGGKCADCAEREERMGVLQRSATAQEQPAVVPPIVYDVLRSSGQPLDAPTRSYMEPRFGHDFSQVRVHTDARAAESARAVSALAYTVGRDVVFGAGQHAPHTAAGRQLMAHELTHVVQQGGRGGISERLVLGHSTSEAEVEAHRLGSQILSHDSPNVVSQHMPSGLWRSEGFEHIQVVDTAARRNQIHKDFIVLKSHERDLKERTQPVNQWPQQWVSRYEKGTAEQQRALKDGLTYGEVSALVDHYRSFQELWNAPLAEIYNLVALVNSEKASTHDFTVATGGRSLEAAKDNREHFSTGDPGKTNLDVWRNMHREAIEIASMRPRFPANYNMALAINAAADHFLTDAFSSGHVQMQREQRTASDTAHAFDRLEHNVDSDVGVLVMNCREEDGTWMAFGDGRHMDTRNARNRDLAVEAVALSQRDIVSAYSGKAPSSQERFEAELLAPFAVGEQRFCWNGRSAHLVAKAKPPPTLAETLALESEVKASMRETLGELPSALRDWYQSDVHVRDWVSDHADALGRLSKEDKVRMTCELTWGWISDADVAAIVQLCKSVERTDEGDALFDVISARMSFSDSQEKRLTKAIDEMPHTPRQGNSKPSDKWCEAGRIASGPRWGEGRSLP